MRRIGLYGGTFDPIHCGHLQVAAQVRRDLGLERIVLIPSALPPHKSGPLATARDRLAMTRLAVEGQPGWAVSDAEIRRGGPSFTIDTLRDFGRRLPPDSRLYFLMGLDAFLEIDTWKSFRRLFEAADFIVMNRPGTSAGDDPARAVAEFLRVHFSDGYRQPPDRTCFRHPDLRPVHLAVVTPQPVSATDIRQRVRQGACIRELVPAAVADYIASRGLYR